MKLTPYWYEDFSVEDLKDVLIDADSEKIEQFEEAIKQAKEHRKLREEKVRELLVKLDNLIDKTNKEDFTLYYKSEPVDISYFYFKENI